MPSAKGDVRLISFTENGGSAVGIVKNEGVFPLADLGFGSALEFIAAGERAILTAERAALASQKLRPLSGVKLLAPIPRPAKILCVGLNYRDHAIESRMEIPPVPTVFAKYPTAGIRPRGPLLNSVPPGNPRFQTSHARPAVQCGESRF